MLIYVTTSSDTLSWQTQLPWYDAVGTWSAEMSGRYPGVRRSITKLSVRVSPICLSELVAMVVAGSKYGRSPYFWSIFL